jgi:hypothetical protein
MGGGRLGQPRPLAELRLDARAGSAAVGGHFKAFARIQWLGLRPLPQRAVTPAKLVPANAGSGGQVSIASHWLPAFAWMTGVVS